MKPTLTFYNRVPEEEVDRVISVVGQVVVIRQTGAVATITSAELAVGDGGETLVCFTLEAEHDFGLTLDVSL